ncbi:hypothetical protein OPQ81_008121 [Rhizoctonia solani]|nr:hypothetical protein OPQ81_008121 [Rhizoctonia solani]
MEDSALAEVTKTTTAKQAWKCVVECWEGKGMQSLMFLYHQLTMAKIKEDEDLTTGFNNLWLIASKMKTLALPALYVIVSTVISSASQNSTVSSDQVMKTTTTKEEH